jgi:hypothetical protein
VRTIQQGQSLSFGLKAGDDRPGILPGLTILIATILRTGSFCLAMKTTPQPPSPICCNNL